MFPCNEILKRQRTVSFLLCTCDQQKYIICLEDHPVNISTNIGSNWLSGFREED